MKSKLIAIVVVLLNVIDTFLTYFFVFHSKLAVEYNPLITSVYMLVTVKLLFFIVYFHYYLKYSNTKQFNYVSYGISIFYTIMLCTMLIG